MVLIDYEYGMWNPQYYDLGNYFNEMICDNAYPQGTGVAYFMSNWPTEQEIETLTRKYWELLQQKDGKDAKWDISKADCSDAIKQVQQGMVLNNFYWAVWAVMMLSDADETDVNAFNWDFLLGRCIMHKKCVELYGIGQI